MKSQIPPKGINWLESRQRYQVRAVLNGKRVHVGRFKTLAEAKRELAAAKIAYSRNWL